jgi:hypothetical protein
VSYEVLLPGGGGRFGNLLDDRIPFPEEGLHIAAQDEGFGYAAEQRDGCGKPEDIAHLGLTAGKRAEVVVVLHGVEGAAEHGVLKIGWGNEGGDLRSQTLTDEEVTGASGDGVAEREQTSCGALEGDCLLAKMGVAGEMNLDRAGKIEAAFDGCGNYGRLVERNHGLVKG